MIVLLRERNGLYICNGYESAADVIPCFAHRAHRLAKASKSLESSRGTDVRVRRLIRARAV
jgi:hypothetical protein